MAAGIIYLFKKKKSLMFFPTLIFYPIHICRYFVFVLNLSKLKVLILDGWGIGGIDSDPSQKVSFSQSLYANW